MKLDKASVVGFLYPLVVETSECHHVNIFKGRETVMKKVRRDGEERVTVKTDSLKEEKRRDSKICLNEKQSKMNGKKRIRDLDNYE
jgi:hypothetical protein